MQRVLPNLNIAGKISFLAAAMLIPMAAACAFGLRQINQLGGEIGEMAGREIPLMRNLNGVTVSQFQQSNALFLSLERGEQLEEQEASWEEFSMQRQRFREHGRLVHNHMNAATALVEKAIAVRQRNAGRFAHLAHGLRGLSKQYADWEFAAERALNLTVLGKKKEALQARRRIAQEREELDAAVRGLFFRIERFSRDSASASVARKNHITVLVIGIFLLGFAVAIGLGMFITLSITRPLRTAVDVADRISAGERSIPIPTDSTDETGQLLSTMDEMLRSVQATERQLEVLSHKYELILQSAGEGIVMLDSEGTITYINPSGAEMLGRKSEALIGCSFHRVAGCRRIGTDSAPVCPLRGATDQEATNGGGEQILRRNDGTTFPAYCTVAPLQKEDESRGLVIVMNDITERKEAEEQLQKTIEELNRSNEELEQFAYAASHDLQEPLRKVTAFGERLLTRCGDELDERGRAYLEHMEDAARRMRQLINDLLTYSRISTRAQPFQQVDLQVVAQNVVEDLAIPIEELGGRVEIGELPTVEGEPVQMRQLLQNLIGNGLKFHREEIPPVVKVNAEIIEEGDGKICRLTVTDNGIGFEEKYRDRIFSIFQRLHPRGEYSGTGVGLALCQKIAQRHHGEISVHSTPGQGSTFEVCLPAKQSS